MRVMTLMALLLSSFNANAVEFSLISGFATHYDKSPLYNDSVFGDSRTSTNTILNIKQSNINLSVVHDSQGAMSFGLAYEQNLVSSRFGNFSLLAGTYILRSEKISAKFAQSPINTFPSFSVGKREFSVTPLVGLNYNKQIYKNIDFNIMISPAFTLFSVKYKVGK